MKNSHKKISFIFEPCLLAAIFFLFLSLNGDSRGQIYWKTIALICIFLPFVFWSLSQEKSSEFFLSRAACFCFFLYEIVRFVWLVLLQKGNLSVSNGISLARYYQHSLLWALLILLFFQISAFYFKNRSRVVRLVLVLAMSGFFLAMNGLPNLMISKAGNLTTFFYNTKGHWTYLHPIFESIHPWITKNILVALPHTNYLGDLIALAAFPAAGLAIYWLWLAFDRLRASITNQEEVNEGSWVHPFCSFGILFLATLTMFAVIFRLYSRGTMLCFFIALFYFAVLFFIQSKPTLIKMGIFALIFFSLIGFLFWAGNLEKAWWEMLSVQNETTESGSFSANAEGAFRAKGIYLDYPIWGAGNGGYIALNQNYRGLAAIQAKGRGYRYVNSFALSHYWTLLAEEGAGAYFYFLFFIAYLVDFWVRFFQVRSRFQVLVALSCHAVVVMVMIHASFGHVMDRFSVPLLVFILMGTSLALLRADFGKAE